MAVPGARYTSSEASPPDPKSAGRVSAGRVSGGVSSGRICSTAPARRESV